MKINYNSGHGTGNLLPVVARKGFGPKWLALCTALVILTAAPVWAQSPGVTLDIRGKAITDVLEAIESQTDYRFYYNGRLIDMQQPVTVRAENENTLTVLDRIFPGMGIAYKVNGNDIILTLPGTDTSSRQAGSIRIEGTIKDAAGNPLIGASVVIAGRNTGTTTDVNGRYSLTVADRNTRLRFNYIGYAMQEHTVGSRTVIDVTLEEDVNVVDEVVVVGYGIQKKVNLTGATATVTSRELADRPVANVGQALQGAVPNLNITFQGGRPGQSASYNIRGNTSPNGGSPLILVDGIETNPDRINSNDIESVTVLKDAASAAIYGARAAFGVILITTKSGERESTQVSYTGRFSVSQRTTSTDFETRGYYSASIADFFTESQQGVPYTTYTESDYKALWERRNDKKEHPDRPWVVTDFRNGRQQYLYLANFDWYNYLYDDRRPTHDHDINVSGGTKKASYMVSGRYYDQRGVHRISPDGYTSYNMRIKLSTEITPWLTFSNNTKYFNGKYSYMGLSSLTNNFSLAGVHGLASIPAVNPDGTAVSHTSTSYSGTHYVMDGYNALMQKGKSKGNNKTQEFSTMFELDFEPIKDLHVKADFSYTSGYLANNYRSVRVEYSMFPGEILQESESNYPDSYQEVVNDQRYYVADIYASYEKSISGKHNIGAIAGYNYEAKYLKDHTIVRKDLLSEDLNDFNLATGDVTNLRGGQNEYAIMGIFSRITYNYDEKYLLELNGRYDGTSRFPRGQRYGFFPSASVGYRISEEAFFNPARKYIDNLKIRASYGSLGNQQIGYYDYIQEISTTGTMSYTFDGSSLAGRATIGNPVSSNLTWEKVISKNIGLDVNMLGNRLELNGDFYIRDVKGILAGGKSLPSFYGASEPLVNANDMRARGYEITVRWRDSFSLAGKPFHYSIAGSLGDYKAFYTKCDNPTGLLGDPYVGKRLGELWGYRVDGLFRSDEEAAEYASRVDLQHVCREYYSSVGAYGMGVRGGDMRYLDLDGDNVVTNGTNTLEDHGDMEVIGNTQPRYSFGMNIGLNWNNFDLSVFAQGIGHMDWYPGASNIWFFGPYSRAYATFLPRNFMSDVWSEENPGAYYPRARSNSANNSGFSLTTVNDRYMQNLAYLRLKNLTFGYTIPEHITSKWRISRLRVYFSGDNLATWTALRSKFLDPEQAATGISRSNAYPFSKTYSFGINLNF